MKYKYGIIIPVHNRVDYTTQCLRGLQDISLKKVAQIYIIDDGSSDGTSEVTRSEFPDVKIVQGTGSLFWTGGIELGMKVALDDLCEGFVWLNDDTEIQPDDLVSMIKYSVIHQHEVIAPRAIDIDSMPLANGAIGRNSIKGENGKDIEVEVLSGYCVVFARKLCDAIGLPEFDKVPHYAGDSYYTIKARKAGFKIKILGMFCVKVLDKGNAVNFNEFIFRGGVKKTFAQVFISVRSPYRLRTKMHLLRLKYGLVGGFVIFCLTAMNWIVRYILAKLK